MASTGTSIQDLAEGTPPGGDIREPVNPLQTTTAPIVQADKPQTDGSETGLIATVHAEGKDKDESQDASRTPDETQNPAVVSQPVSAPAVAEVPGTKPRVLIVEDTIELAEVIQATLERMNLDTVHEAHGGKAMGKLKEARFDLVLLDIALPDTTGWKILESIKGQHKDVTRDPIVIIITAYGDPANKLVGKLQGVYSYLVKPFTPDDIEKVVRQALSSLAH